MRLKMTMRDRVYDTLFGHCGYLNKRTLDICNGSFNTARYLQRVETNNGRGACQDDKIRCLGGYTP